MLQSGCLPFDTEVGGLSAYGVHLIQGGPAAAVSEFCFRFLDQGLRADDRVALITSLAPADAIGSALRAGIDLRPFLRSRNLFVFDYPEDLQENLRGVTEDEAIAQELLQHLAAENIDRLVIDPVTPLIAGLDAPALVRRLRALVDEIQSLNATTLIVAGARANAAALERCSVLFDDILRFEAPEGPSGAVRIEVRQSRHPGFGGREVWLHPELQVHAADQVHAANEVPRPQPSVQRARSPLPLPEMPSLLLAAPVQKPRVLVMDPVEARRAQVRTALEVFADVHEARGIVDGYGLLWSTPPDLLVVAEQLPGVTGRELIQKLRRTGREMPVIAVGSHLRRTEDQAELLEAGADACFTQPLPMRLLQHSAVNWIRRTKPAFANLKLELPPLETATADEINCTADAEYFCRRVERQVEIARDEDAPLSVILMHCPGISQPAEEIASACAMTIRRHDLVWSGARGIAVLLTGCRDAASFLARFHSRCAVRPYPSFEVLTRESAGDRLPERVRSGVGELALGPDLNDATPWPEPLRRAQSVAHASMGGLGHAS